MLWTDFNLNFGSKVVILAQQYPVREQDEEGKTVKEVEPEMKAVMAYYTKEVCKDVENGESEGSLEF